MPAGYLWVESDPGAKATLEEYHDWYNNEHVPLRLENIADFLTGARLEATDNKFPHFTAAYDISSTDLFSDPRYTSLRANRSPREGELISRLAILDRRTGRTLKATSPPSYEASTSPFVLSVADDSFEESDLSLFPTAKRAAAHEIYDALVIGVDREPSSKVPKYLVLYEFDSEDYKSTPEFKALESSKKEVRTWKLYRAWKNTAK